MKGIMGCLMCVGYIICIIVAGKFAWNWTEPNSFWGFIYFLFVWSVVGGIVLFIWQLICAFFINLFDEWKNVLMKLNKKIILAIALLMCLLPMPYGYYILIRYVSAIIFCITAFYKSRKGYALYVLVYLCCFNLFLNCH